MSKHNGINATRDVLKDQLALAASEIERLRGLLPRTGQIIEIPCAPVPNLAVVVAVVLACFVGAAILLSVIF